MMHATADLVFLGYRAKRPLYVGFGGTNERIICSVSTDLCRASPEWVDRWDFNLASCYESPEAAWASVSVNPDRYVLFAYFILPVDFSDDEEEIFSIEEIFPDGLPEQPTGTPDLSGMTLLGYDVTECQDWHLDFGVSPIVQSGISRPFLTNRYGLLDDFEEAVAACKFFNAQIPAHVPMWVIQVFSDESVNDFRSNEDSFPWGVPETSI